MKKPNLNPIILVSLFFVVFLVGFFLGRINYAKTPSLLPSPVAHSEATQMHTDHSYDSFYNGKLNINVAEAEDLILLPGIGKVLAQRIIDYRIRNGPYMSVDDLLKVEGIGTSILSKFSAYITIGG